MEELLLRGSRTYEPQFSAPQGSLRTQITARPRLSLLQSSPPVRTLSAVDAVEEQEMAAQHPAVPTGPTKRGRKENVSTELWSTDATTALFTARYDLLCQVP
ncbi:hypothetical protein GN244_ATG03970 [Phytophthora infestans]|uniref:Uncharacterized protein n=1 Tax=Phytophthora infestans TaxID=4787 RepID=A0A833WK53_PHYIN|nr:hypothetical protein GN244_ATG03970 [Phytophthora infestans]